MSETSTIDWKGISGKEYRFWIHPIGTNFKKGSGNYIFAKEVEPHKWKPIYIGQTKDFSERFDNHHKMPCILKNGATAIHVLINDDGEDSRLSEEEDLIKCWSPPCND